MARPDNETPDDRLSTVYREYILEVKILEVATEDGTRYQFEAPRNEGIEFTDPDTAELYADVYFDVNGFTEAGTGERGIPPELIQAGKDTLAVYLLTQPGIDVDWVASFYGRKPSKIEQYVSWVRERAAEIRDGAAERDIG